MFHKNLILGDSRLRGVGELLRCNSNESFSTIFKPTACLSEITIELQNYANTYDKIFIVGGTNDVLKNDFK